MATARALPISATHDFDLMGLTGSTVVTCISYYLLSFDRDCSAAVSESTNV